MADRTIQITQDLRLHQDPLNWAIERRHVVQDGKRKGETDWRPDSYYGTLQGACRGLLRLGPPDGVAEDLRALCSLWDAWCARIEAAVGEEQADG